MKREIMVIFTRTSGYQTARFYQTEAQAMDGITRLLYQGFQTAQLYLFSHNSISYEVCGTYVYDDTNQSGKGDFLFYKQ